MFNIGSGDSRTVGDVAIQLASILGRPELAPRSPAAIAQATCGIAMRISGARKLLSFEPRTSFEEGLEELAVWLGDATAVDRVDEATEELVRRGWWHERRISPAPARRRRADDVSASACGASPIDGADHWRLRFRRSEPGRPARLGGERVLLYDNLSRPNVGKNLEWLQQRHGRRVETVIADVSDADALRETVRQASAVFHLAAQVAVTNSLDDPVSDFETNARGTLNVLEAARRALIRLPWCSHPPTRSTASRSAPADWSRPSNAIIPRPACRVPSTRPARSACAALWLL